VEKRHQRLLKRHAYSELQQSPGTAQGLSAFIFFVMARHLSTGSALRQSVAESVPIFCGCFGFVHVG
jgi:hypothetical protein